jgi:hypothetical protein
MNPFPVTVTNGTSINFDMTQLNTGAINFEAYDSTGTQYQPIGPGAPFNATLVGGSYSFFLWSGALPANGSVTGNVLANSGIMSEFKDINVTP